MLDMPLNEKERDTRQVCGRCGAIVASGRATCFVCNAPGGEARPLERHPELLFALVTTSELTCQQCALKSPVSHLDLRSEVDCERCGATQAIDNQQWVDALELAHVTTELSAGLVPDPFVRPDRDFDAVAELIGASGSGINRQLDGALITWTGKEPSEYQIHVSPGMPLCSRCHARLAVALDAGGAVTTHCSACSEGQSYLLPSSAAPLAGGLVGVIGEDHRSDRTVARGASKAGSAALALECPKCNASLTPEPEQRFVTCGYCGAVSLIPPRFMRRSDAKLAPFWLVFRGSSRHRQKLEQQRDAERAAAREEERRTAEARKLPAEEAPRGSRAMLLVVVAIVLAALVGIVVFVVR